jgi:hypothetical protein
MHELENALGNLYELFAMSFPEHHILWHTLVKEEYEHAEAVRNLYKLTFEGESLFNVGRIKPEAVQSIIDRVNEARDRLHQGKFTELEAVSFTCDIESSLIAKDIFRYFEVSPEFSEMLRYLREGSEGHVQLARNELNKLQNG